MMRPGWKVIFTATLGTAAAFASVTLAQQQPAEAAAAAASASTSPVALVYVASTPKNSSTNEIVGFSAASTGKLTPIPGSPFAANVTAMAVNGKYLFAPNNATPFIESYRIEPNGTLKFAAQTDYMKADPSSNCGGGGPVFLDHTGASLYMLEFDGTVCANNVYESFAVNNSTGGLKYLSYASGDGFPQLASAASFIGNNRYAYIAENDSDMYIETFGYLRNSNGYLTKLNLNTPFPSSPPSGAASFCPYLAAADPMNHVAFIEQPCSPPGSQSGNPELAVYTASSNGSLTTTSSGKNMPTISMPYVNALSMAPSGKLLAVAGVGGLQIFHVNGASPITKYTGLLTTSTINSVFWDKSNHLYAISESAGKLYVFTVTPTSHIQASGSPYSVSNPVGLIVQPAPW
jgi:hypothetical protein